MNRLERGGGRERDRISFPLTLLVAPGLFIVCYIDEIIKVKKELLGRKTLTFLTFVRCGHD